MAKYSNIKLTQKGLDIAINADKSKKLIYTHIGLGDGRLANNEDVLTLTAMKSRKIYADIADINNDTNNQVTLETVISNKVVNEGFYAREIGIYAKLGDNGQEVLYGYANAGDEADYMPDKTQPIDELKLRITLIVGNVDNVTAIVNSSIIFITLADCRREIARHNADPLAHYNLARKDDYYTKAQTYNKGEINQSFRKIGDKRVGGSVDWNTLTEPMTYNIQNALMNNAMHAPPNEYNFGLLVVHRLENGKDHENRTVQVYYPHATRGYWSRMLNGSGWLDWRYIPTHNEVEVIAEQKANTRVSKSGDTMTGMLSFALNKGKIVGKVGNDASYWQIWGSDNKPSTAYDIYGNGTNADKGVIYARKYVNGTEVVLNKLIAEDNNAYFQHAVNANRFYSNNWYRSTGNSGWLNETHGGGWYMQDSDWIRALNGKNIYTTGKLRGDNGVEVTGSAAFIFASHGGALYMSDDTWIRSSSGKSIYTAGRMKADAGFEGKATSAGRADSSVVSDRAVRVENDNTNMRFHWAGQGGQPSWLWGGNDGENMYVYNPANFTVSRANTAGTADNAKNFDGRSLSNILGLIDAANTGAVEARLEENGYIKIRNGFLLQWGILKNIKIDQNNRDVSFVKRFNKCFNVLLTISQDTFISGANCPYVKRGSITQNGFTVIPDHSSEIVDADIFYIAIGV